MRPTCYKANETDRCKTSEVTNPPSIGDGGLVTNAEGWVTRLNPIAKRLTGWTEAQARGCAVDQVFRIVNEHSRQPATIPVEKVLATGLVAGLANHTVLVARDGAECPIADSAAPSAAGMGGCWEWCWSSATSRPNARPRRPCDGVAHGKHRGRVSGDCVSDHAGGHPAIRSCDYSRTAPPRAGHECGAD